MNLLISENMKAPAKKPTAVNKIINNVLKKPKIQKRTPMTKKKKAVIQPALIFFNFSNSFERNLSISSAFNLGNKRLDLVDLDKNGFYNDTGISFDIFLDLILNFAHRGRYLDI